MPVLATAPAKINLTLAVTGRRNDGYHRVHTVMQAVDLRETIEVWNREEPGIELSVVGADLPANENNTAYKAAKVFFEKTGLPPAGIGIRVRKQIPMGAGLAGGSADAAAVLAGLNELTGAHLSVERLCEWGGFVGADVPFCVLGGTAVGTGTGADLSPLPAMPDCFLVIAKPADGISTPEAYRLIDESKISLTHSLSAAIACPTGMEEAVKKSNLPMIARALMNDFDAVTKLPGVEAIKAVMRAEGTLGCQMTGSGSAAFGIFTDENRAISCRNALKRQYSEVYLCHPDPCGAKIQIP